MGWARGSSGRSAPGEHHCARRLQVNGASEGFAVHAPAAAFVEEAGEGLDARDYGHNGAEEDADDDELEAREFDEDDDDDDDVEACDFEDDEDSDDELEAREFNDEGVEDDEDSALERRHLKKPTGSNPKPDPQNPDNLGPKIVSGQEKIRMFLVRFGETGSSLPTYCQGSWLGMMTVYFHYTRGGAERSSTPSLINGRVMIVILQEKFFVYYVHCGSLS